MITIMLRTLASLAILLILSGSPVLAKKQCDPGDLTSLYDLVSKPDKFMKKKVSFEGDFHFYSSLALDYEKAMRPADEYISLVLSRPDMKDIPLVELKMAVPIKYFKKEDLQIEHGDRLRINGKVFAVELGEPWIDIYSIEVLEEADKNKVGKTKS